MKSINNLVHHKIQDPVHSSIGIDVNYLVIYYLAERGFSDSHWDTRTYYGVYKNVKESLKKEIYG
jgi:hypothetical protein